MPSHAHHCSLTCSLGTAPPCTHMHTCAHRCPHVHLISPHVHHICTTRAHRCTTCAHMCTQMPTCAPQTVSVHTHVTHKGTGAHNQAHNCPHYTGLEMMGGLDLGLGPWALGLGPWALGLGPGLGRALARGLGPGPGA